MGIIKELRMLLPKTTEVMAIKVAVPLIRSYITHGRSGAK